MEAAMMYYLVLLGATLSYLLAPQNATATLFSETDTTNLELSSASNDTYQVAGVYNIVDYNKKMDGFGYGGRVNDNGGTRSNSKCSTYPGYISSSECTSPKEFPSTAKPTIIAGMKCYKKSDCVCPKKFKYAPATGTALPTPAGSTSCTPSGASCGGKYENCTCPSNYKYYSDSTLLPNPFIRVSFDAILSGTYCTPAHGIKLYTDFTCPSDYKKEADGCTKDCSGYDKTSCDTAKGEICAQCTTSGGVTKYKITSCNEDEGWKISGLSSKSLALSCKAADCPTDFSTNITGCSVDGYTLTTDGKSGGKPCGKCVCGRTKDCSAYPLTAADKATSHGSGFSSCKTGCGDDLITKYKILSCKSGYKLMDGKCVSDTCDTENGYSETACTETQKRIDKTTTATGKTCYLCKDDTCPEKFYKGCAPRHIETGEKAVTVAGTTCVKCRVRKCEEYTPEGTYKTTTPEGSSCTSIKLPVTDKAENQITCYTNCKNDTCNEAGGYTKTPCTTPDLEEARTITAAGSTCYKCKTPSVTCASMGGSETKPSEYRYCTEKTVNGKKCYMDCKCLQWKAVKTTMSVKNDYKACTYFETQGDITLDENHPDSDIYDSWCGIGLQTYMDEDGDNALFYLDICSPENKWLKKPSDNKFISHVAGGGYGSKKVCQNSVIQTCSQRPGNNSFYYNINNQNQNWSIQGYTSASQIIEASGKPTQQSALSPGYPKIDTSSRLLCYSYTIDYDIGCVFAAYEKPGYRYLALEDYSKPILSYGTVKGYGEKWETEESYLYQPTDENYEESTDGVDAFDDFICNRAIKTDNQGCQKIFDYEDTDKSLVKSLVPKCYD